MWISRGTDYLIARTPAKVNLFLEVLGKRGDGFHEIETLMASIDLADSLQCRHAPEGPSETALDCRWSPALAGGCAPGELPPTEQNLAWRAVERVRQGVGGTGRVALRLEKRIPSAAGLGGASSDAAAAMTLAAMTLATRARTDDNANRDPARVANCNARSRTEWKSWGAELGSDIPYFLERGPAVCRGRGERVEPCGPLPPLHLVLLRPPFGLSTAEVYRHCRPAAEPRAVAPLLAAWRGGDIARLGRLLFNRLQEPAEQVSPELAQLARRVRSLDCLGSLMSGSGSTLFLLCRNAAHARRAAGRLRQWGVGWVRPVRTLTGGFPPREGS